MDTRNPSGCLLRKGRRKDLFENALRLPPLMMMIMGLWKNPEKEAEKMEVDSSSFFLGVFRCPLLRLFHLHCGLLSCRGCLRLSSKRRFGHGQTREKHLFSAEAAFFLGSYFLPRSQGGIHILRPALLSFS